MVAHTGNLTNWEVGSRSEIQGHHWLNSKFEGSLGYMKLKMRRRQRKKVRNKVWGETEAGREGGLQTHNPEAFQKSQRSGQGLASLCQLVTLAKWLPISTL